MQSIIFAASVAVTFLITVDLVVSEPWINNNHCPNRDDCNSDLYCPLGAKFDKYDRKFCLKGPDEKCGDNLRAGKCDDRLICNNCGKCAGCLDARNCSKEICTVLKYRSY